MTPSNLGYQTLCVGYYVSVFRGPSDYQSLEICVQHCYSDMLVQCFHIYIVEQAHNFAYILFLLFENKSCIVYFFGLTIVDTWESHVLTERLILIWYILETLLQINTHVWRIRMNSSSIFEPLIGANWYLDRDNTGSASTLDSNIPAFQDQLTALQFNRTSWKVNRMRYIL